jgi:hypothetical protein
LCDFFELKANWLALDALSSARLRALLAACEMLALPKLLFLNTEDEKNIAPRSPSSTAGEKYSSRKLYNDRPNPGENALPDAAST